MSGTQDTNYSQTKDSLVHGINTAVTQNELEIAKEAVNRIIFATVTATTLCVGDPAVAFNRQLTPIGITLSDVSISGSESKGLLGLSSLFEMKNPREIKTFLIQHSGLVPFLIECQIEIGKRFPNAIPKIELTTDMEVADWKVIYIKIPTSLSFEDSFSRLSDLLKSWMRLQSKSLRKLITIAIE